MNTNERPTPETDVYIKAAWGSGFAAKELEEPMRRLERERDEARDRIAELEKQLAELQKPKKPKKPKEQDTFEAYGMTWIKHTPGDPMPCNPETRTLAITNRSRKTSDAPWVRLADEWNWSDSLPEEWQIIGWNYADAP